MTQNLHTTLVVPRYWPAMGGAEQHSRQLAQSLTRHGQVDVVHLRSTEQPATDVSYAWNATRDYQDGSVACSQISAPAALGPVLRSLSPGAKPGGRALRAAFAALARPAMYRQLRALTPHSTVVHSIYNGCTPLAEAAASLPQPWVFTPLAHTTLKAGTGWSAPSFQRLYRRADALIAMTDYERHWLIEQGAEAHKVHVVPMAPLFETEQVESEEVFRARYGLGSDPYIFFLGRMTQAKGVPPLLEAMPPLWQRYPDLRLVLAGPADDPIQGAAAAVLKDPRVIHAGLIDGASKRAALSYCQFLCVPSTEESLGVIYLEAWAHGRPVIAADTPVMRAVIDAGQDGLLVAPQAADIARAASQLLAQPQWADQLGERGRVKVQQCYSWESSARRLAAIYAQLAAQPRPQPA